MLTRVAATSTTEIVERSKELATGQWVRIGMTSNPRVSAKIIAGQVDLAVEWPDVNMMTDGDAVIVTVTDSIPDIACIAATGRAFSTLADIDQLRELDGLKIAQIESGEITTIVMRDIRRIILHVCQSRH